MRKAVVTVSGGADSVTLAHKLKADGYDVIVLSFDYGQRHLKELEFAKGCAENIGAKYIPIDLSSVGEHLTGSALTSDIDVPDGHYAADNMKVTVVPNRNAIMLAIAYGVAVSNGAELVATAVHAGDHFVYPDCRPRFITAFDIMQSIAVEGYGHESLRLLAPFSNIGKHDIVAIGDQIGVDYAKTWSCYNGRDIHCGTCGTCVERKEAFYLAGVIDPTLYKK